ncbi:rhombosortase [Shewanella polaris]|uniref:Rhombosortase n=1 Tax=Shewanella polaris TaxID=2588449 RepID=A0A4Y5YF23_9GAMM|nr:rhombosortase [Shewanella polaris]QDE31381.1 rhombosortase [Shewanella polaris]
MQTHKTHTVRLYHLVVVISLICIGLFAVEVPSPAFLPIDQYFSYQYDAIAHGQIWRLITGNLLHTNIWHLLMNLAGFWVIIFLYEVHFKRNPGKLMLLFVSLCLLEGMGLYLFYPNLKAYVGLSGLLHGLFVFGAIMDIRKGYRSGYLLLVGVILKVAYEQYFGASHSITHLINARVATESHLVGLVSGIMCAIFWSMLVKRLKYNKLS